MDSMLSSLRNAFRSERLIYKAMEDTEEIRNYYHEELRSEPAGTGLSDPTPLKPASRAKSDEQLKKTCNNAALAVVMCLPPADDTDKEASPTKIGLLVLNKGEPWVRSVSVGVRIAAQYQNKGYGREALNWALDWAFRWGEMHRVSIGAVSFNDRAIALYRSIGFVDEGRNREVVYFDGQWHDMLFLAMLEKEWKVLRGLE